MSSLPATLRDVDLAKRTLAVLQWLKPALYRSDGPQVTTSAVDGEFYWRAARGDFTERVLSLRHQFGIENDANLEQTHVSLFGTAVALMSRDFGLPEPAVRRHVLLDERILVREPFVSVAMEPNPDTGHAVLPRITVCIPSASITGGDVTRLLERIYPQLESPFFETMPPASPHTSNPVNMQFDPPEQGAKAIEFHIRLPLPPAATIGKAYDDIVRDLHRWHTLLPDGKMSGQQTPEVSARTWTLGLFLHAGLSYRRARDQFESVTKMQGVEEPKFVVDRQTLVRRVPEARDLLYKNTRQIHQSAPITKT